MARSLVGNTSWGAVASLLSAASRFVSAAILARVLHPTDYGTYFFLAALSEFLVIALCLGGPAVLTRYLPARPRQDGSLLIGWAVRRALLGAVACAGGVAFLVLADWWTQIFATRSTALLLLLLFSQAALTVQNSILAGLRRFEYVAKAACGSSAVLLTGQLTLSPAFGLDGALTALVLANIAHVLLAYVGVRPHVVGTNPAHGTLDDLNQIRSYALNSGLATLLSALVWNRSEVFFLEWLSSSGEIAKFGVAFTAIAPITVALGMLGAALTPHFAGKISKDTGPVESRSAREDYALLTVLMASLSIPFSFILSASSPFLIPFLFGPQYESAVHTAQVLVLGGALGFANVGSSLQYASGRSAFILKTSTAGAVIMACLLYVVVPAFGALGAACVRVALQAALIFVGTSFNVRVLGLVFPAKQLLRILLISLVCSSPAFYFSAKNQLLEFLVSVFLGAVMMLALGRSLGLFSRRQQVRLRRLQRRLIPGWMSGERAGVVR